MSGIAWTPTPIYDSFSHKLGLFDVFFLRSTILRRIKQGQAQVDDFIIEEIDDKFDTFWKDCDVWYYNTTTRSERYRNVHLAIHKYIWRAIEALKKTDDRVSYRETVLVLQPAFYDDAYLMFGVGEDEIQRCADDGWLFSGAATKNDPLNLMHYWLNGTNTESPFIPKARCKWFQYLREHSARGVVSESSLLFHDRILRDSSYMAAMTRLARELRHKCADAGVAVEIDSSITDLVWAVCDPLSGTERMNFRNQSEGFEPNDLDGDEVQLDYLEVTVTKRVLTPNLGGSDQSI